MCEALGFETDYPRDNKQEIEDVLVHLRGLELAFQIDSNSRISKIKFLYNEKCWCYDIIIMNKQRIPVIKLSLGRLYTMMVVGHYLTEKLGNIKCLKELKFSSIGASIENSKKGITRIYEFESLDQILPAIVGLESYIE